MRASGRSDGQNEVNSNFTQFFESANMVKIFKYFFSMFEAFAKFFPFCFLFTIDALSLLNVPRFSHKFVCCAFV